MSPYTLDELEDALLQELREEPTLALIWIFKELLGLDGKLSGILVEMTNPYRELLDWLCRAPQLPRSQRNKIIVGAEAFLNSDPWKHIAARVPTRMLEIIDEHREEAAAAAAGPLERLRSHRALVEKLGAALSRLSPRRYASHRLTRMGLAPYEVANIFGISGSALTRDCMAAALLTTPDRLDALRLLVERWLSRYGRDRRVSEEAVVALVDDLRECLCAGHDLGGILQSIEAVPLERFINGGGDGAVPAVRLRRIRERPGRWMLV
jgi:hypothetical protein